MFLLEKYAVFQGPERNSNDNHLQIVCLQRIHSGLYLCSQIMKVQPWSLDQVYVWLLMSVLLITGEFIFLVPDYFSNQFEGFKPRKRWISSKSSACLNSWHHLGPQSQAFLWITFKRLGHYLVSWTTFKGPFWGANGSASARKKMHDMKYF